MRPAQTVHAHGRRQPGRCRVVSDLGDAGQVAAEADLDPNVGGLAAVRRDRDGLDGTVVLQLTDPLDDQRRVVEGRGSADEPATPPGRDTAGEPIAERRRRSRCCG
jgi:hypothetical protein